MSPDSTPPPTAPGRGSASRWAQLYGQDTGSGYAERFAKLAASGRDMHGEASLCADLVQPPARVLDAGCGTGRVAIRLAELGYSCAGVDADASMLAQARRAAPHLRWELADLAELDLPDQPFDLVVAAGNVIPLLAAGTLQTTLSRLAAHITSGGSLVCGFGLDTAHLPPGCPVTSLNDFDAACAGAGLLPLQRWSSWDRDPLGEDPGYVVTMHTRR